MNCKKCGFPLDNNDQFCKSCGEPVKESEIKIEEIGEIEILGGEEPSISEPIITESIDSIESPLEKELIKPKKEKTEPKKDNTIIRKIIILVIFLIILIGVLVLVKNNISKEKKTNIDNSSMNSNNTTVYRISYGGFTFSIPEDLIYETKNNVLLIADVRGSWVAQLEIQPGSYSKLRTNKNKLPGVIEKYGYISKAVNEKKAANQEYIVLEVDANGSNQLIALANIHPNYFAGITILSQNQEFDYSILEKLSPVISTATYSDTNASIDFSSGLNMYEFTELAK